MSLTPDTRRAKDERNAAIRAAFVELRPRYRSDAQTYRALADRYRLDETTIYMIIRGKR